MRYLIRHYNWKGFFTRQLATPNEPYVVIHIRPNTDNTGVAYKASATPEDGNYLQKHVGVNLECIIKIYNAFEHLLVISHRKGQGLLHGTNCSSSHTEKSRVFCTVRTVRHLTLKMAEFTARYELLVISHWKEQGFLHGTNCWSSHTENGRVYCTVRTESSNKIQDKFPVRRGNKQLRAVYFVSGKTTDLFVRYQISWHKRHNWLFTNTHTHTHTHTRARAQRAEGMINRTPFCRLSHYLVPD
jgi:hypothetical protein